MAVGRWLVELTLHAGTYCAANRMGWVALGSALVVTAVELARRLGVDPKRLRGWLRGQAAADHPLLAAHLHYQRWEFNEEDADRLAAEFRGGASAGVPRPNTTRTGTEIPARSDDRGHRVLEKWGARTLRRSRICCGRACARSAWGSIRPR